MGHFIPQKHGRNPLLEANSTTDLLGKFPIPLYSTDDSERHHQKPVPIRALVY